MFYYCVCLFSCFYFIVINGYCVSNVTIEMVCFSISGTTRANGICGVFDEYKYKPRSVEVPRIVKMILALNLASNTAG